MIGTYFSCASIGSVVNDYGIVMYKVARSNLSHIVRKIGKSKLEMRTYSCCECSFANEIVAVCRTADAYFGTTDSYRISTAVPINSRIVIVGAVFNG